MAVGCITELNDISPPEITRPELGNKWLTECTGWVGTLAWLESLLRDRKRAGMRLVDAFQLLKQWFSAFLMLHPLI